MPVAFVPHGGGPWPFVDLGVDRGEVASLATYLRELPRLTPEKPKALLVISAHWEERAPTVMTSARPPMLYDYFGFPPASYTITWPAPGAPDVAARVQELTGAAADAARGFDHGAFVPLKVAYPDADIPALQLSLMAGLEPRAHLELGRMLEPLRDEGVFIVGSGMTFHDLRAFFHPARREHGVSASRTFDAWLRETCVLPRAERDARLAEWAHAPSARDAHPREEHLVPLMVSAGAAGEDRGVVAWEGTYLAMKLSAYHFAS